MLTKLKDLRNVSVPTMYTKVSSVKLCLLCLCRLFNYLFVDVCVVLCCGIDHFICIKLDVILWSPYVIEQTIIFLPFDFYCLSFFFLFFPRLISVDVDWISTILPYMVWP